MGQSLLLFLMNIIYTLNFLFSIRWLPFSNYGSFYPNNLPFIVSNFGILNYYICMLFPIQMKLIECADINNSNKYQPEHLLLAELMTKRAIWKNST